MKKDMPNNEERSQAPRFSYKRADRHRKKTTMAKLNALFAQLGPKRLAVLASVLMLLVTAPVVVLAVAHSAKVTIEKVAITSNTQGGQSQNGRIRGAPERHADAGTHAHAPGGERAKRGPGGAGGEPGGGNHPHANAHAGTPPFQHGDPQRH